MKQFVQLIFFLFFINTFGQQLVYKPANPNFGGDTFNYQWLLSSANAQNSFKDPAAEKEKKSELDTFGETLNRQLLNQLSRALLTSQLGTEGLQEGAFTFGNLEVEVYDSLEGLVINILDTNTGEQTQVIVPN